MQEEVVPDNQVEGAEVPTFRSVHQRKFTLVAPALHALSKPKQFIIIIARKFKNV